jgi:hypothetical protein
MEKSANHILLKLCSAVLLCLFFTNSYSQDSLALKEKIKFLTNLNNTSYGSFPKQVESTLKNLTISGYYRFIANYQHMKTAYSNSPSDTTSFSNTPKKLFIGDDSQIPELMLNISGKPTANTSFGTDLYLWNKMTGLAPSEYVKGLNLGVNLYGSFATDIGNFNIMAGGIHWYSLTPFTFYTNVGYNRYSVFERNPWDPGSKAPVDRYKSFYQSGGITQDSRWGKQAFQGLIVEADDLPYNFSAVVMYGKSVINGGMTSIPNNAIGGKLKKSFGKSFVSVNTFNSKSFTDSLAKKSVGFNMHTIEYNLNWKDFVLSGEVGLGKYFSPLYSAGFSDSSNIGDFGEALNIKLLLPKKYVFLPIEINYFRINSNVINNNSIFWNSSIVETQQNTISSASGNAVLAPFASSMVQIGQLTNNRQGLNINADVNIGKLKLSIGNGISQEISNISTQITYNHPTNNLALSRFWRWSNYPTTGLGPYGNLTKVYRGVYETVNVKDTALALKNFNTIEINAKYAFNILNHDVYLNYLGSYNSIQKKMSAITVFTEEAYIRNYYHQLELYFKVNSNLVIANYFGWERIVGNYNTDLDELTRRPRNQEGLSFATGFDLSLGKNAGLYVRQRWIDYHDYSFKKDKYIGTETTVELKLFF